MPKTPAKPSSKPSSVNKKYIFIAGVLIFSLSLIALTFFYLNHIFTIQKVIVNKGDYTGTLQGVSIFDNENIFLLNEKNAAEQIYQSNSYIKDISIQKKYPYTIYITVSFLQPSAMLEVSEGYFILSSNARILKKTTTKDESLPTLHYYEKLSYNGNKAGDTLDFEDIKASMLFLQKAKDLGLAVNSIDISGHNMIALNTKDHEIIFGLDKSLKDQLYQFETVVREFKIQGKKFKTLDLRYDRVIVGE